jgi:hypothetical protein
MNNHSKIRFHRPFGIYRFTFFPKAEESFLNDLLCRFKILYILLCKNAQTRKMNPEERFEAGFVQLIYDMFPFIFQRVLL